MDDSFIGAGVRTVTHLASHFDQLKKSASELATRISAESRGYFTTREEDDTRAILVSYWKSRNAMMDLILSIRQQADEDDQDYAEAFLLAFAAALILVDAARYLREVTDGRPLVRRKLNEAAPQFGIPANVFDSIQKSLVSTRHGWHLYHAAQYYDEHETRLRELAQRKPPFQSLIAIVDQLKDRIDISVRRFANAKLRTRGDQIVRRVAFRIFGRALYGLQKFVGGMLSDRYVRPGHEPELPEQMRAQIQQRLVPGDVFVVRKEYALTNYFLPGYWPHAALYLGGKEELRSLQIDDGTHVHARWARMMDESAEMPLVLESMKDGVHLRSIRSPFASDSVVVLRPKLAPQLVAEGISRCLAHEGKPYDFDFDFRRSDRLVCTEVVYRAFDGLAGQQLPLVSRAGRPTLSGSDLIQMAIRGDYFEPVVVYAPEYRQEPLIGSDAVTVLEDVSPAR